MEQEFTYPAFISYSRKDSALADKLQNRLETYSVSRNLLKKYPHLPHNFYPVFRDKTAMKLDCLTAAIREGLESSKYLIVICTTNSAMPNDDGKHWVNEEIETFISLHPDNVHRVIPIIFRDKKTNATDCLPPALRADRHDILATDVQEKGLSHAYCDIAAKMTNLNPVQVWNGQWRKMILKRIIAATFAAITTAAGIWWYRDYFSYHHEYFADYVERNTIPEGIAPLKEEELSAHGKYYRFTTYKHRLHMIEYCGADGKLLKHAEFWNADRPSLIKHFTYSSTTESPRELTQRTHCDARGNEYETLMFTHNCHLAEAGMPANQTSSPALGTSIRHLAILKPLEQQIGTLRPNNTSIAGYRLIYGKDGKVVEIACFDMNGKLTVNNEGWAITEIKYDAHGAVRHKLHRDASKNVCRNKRGYASMSIERDASGQMKSVTFQDENDRPCQTSEGIATITWEADTAENKRRICFRNQNNVELTFPSLNTEHTPEQLP